MAAIQNEKADLYYDTFGHLPISDRSPATDLVDRQNLLHPNHDRKRGRWARIILILTAFLLLKVLIIKAFLIPHFDYSSSSTLLPAPMSSPLPCPSGSSESRETVIDLTSNSVTGTYSLYDLLSIHTTSGSIDITLSLKNASSSAPKPAVLDLSTSSGSIRVKTTALRFSSNIPDREYRSSISSSSGSIDAQLVHGSHTSLKTHSGHVNAELTPFGPNTSRSDIETHTNSGGTEITVHPLAVNASQPLRKLYAGYHHGSGSLSVQYPSTWQGKVEGKTMSGGVNVDWDGLRIVRDQKGYVWREIEAVKGEGEGILRFNGYSGSVTLRGDSDGWVNNIPAREGKARSMEPDQEPAVREGGPLLEWQ